MIKCKSFIKLCITLLVLQSGNREETVVCEFQRATRRCDINDNIIIRPFFLRLCSDSNRLRGSKKIRKNQNHHCTVRPLKSRNIKQFLWVMGGGGKVVLMPIARYEYIILLCTYTYIYIIIIYIYTYEILCRIYYTRVSIEDRKFGSDARS